MQKNSKESDSVQTSFVIITVSKKQKRTYSDVWDNLNHSSAAAAVKLLASFTNVSGSTRARFQIQLWNRQALYYDQYQQQQQQQHCSILLVCYCLIISVDIKSPSDSSIGVVNIDSSTYLLCYFMFLLQLSIICVPQII